MSTLGEVGGQKTTPSGNLGDWNHREMVVGIEDWSHAALTEQLMLLVKYACLNVTYMLCCLLISCSCFLWLAKALVFLCVPRVCTTTRSETTSTCGCPSPGPPSNWRRRCGGPRYSANSKCIFVSFILRFHNFVHIFLFFFFLIHFNVKSHSLSFNKTNSKWLVRLLCTPSSGACHLHHQNSVISYSGSIKINCKNFMKLLLFKFAILEPTSCLASFSSCHSSNNSRLIAATMPPSCVIYSWGVLYCCQLRLCLHPGHFNVSSSVLEVSQIQ